MSSIVTKTGDLGTTMNINGENVKKSNKLVDFYGEVDELNACIGLVKNFKIHNDIKKDLENIQKYLLPFSVKKEDITKIEKKISKLEKNIKFTGFQNIDKNISSASLNLLRTITRRVERKAVKAGISGDALVFLNRLSDYFFLLSAEYLN